MNLGGSVIHTLHGDSQTLATQITQWIFAKATMITMSILGPVPPYHALALLQLRNVGHAEVLRIELHHLCTMQHLSTYVVHGNSNAKRVTLWQPSKLLLCHVRSPMRSSNFRWVQMVSVGNLFQVASLDNSSQVINRI